MQIFTYRDFLKDKSSLTFEQAEKIYDNLISSVNIHDPKFQEYWKKLIELCAQYSEARGKWFTLTREEQHSFDGARTVLHNDIRKLLLDIRAWIQEQNGDVSWYAEFNDDRKRMGDFANYLNYVYAVNAR